MANSYNTVTVQSASATLILAANTWRSGVTIYNNSSVTVYIGTDSSVSSSTGMVVGAGGAYDFNGWFSYRGDIYGRAASATADVRYLEWTK
jgi:hypothetical protein